MTSLEDCPRCGEAAVKTETKNVPYPKIAPLANKIPLGAIRRDECGFCKWWSEARWNGQDWVWTTAPKLGRAGREHLEKRLRILKKKRRSFGGKGR